MLLKMDHGHSELNPASLIDLKAELQKKYELFKQAKASKDAKFNRHTPLKNKGENIKEKKKGPIVKPRNVESEEESLALKKSRLALEAKAKLYDKITSNNILIDDEQNELYLVDFQRKVLYNPEPKHTQNDDTKISSKPVEPSPLISSQPISEIHNVLPEMSTNQTKIEQGTSGEVDADDPVHYQNILFNEIRDHGTGYFAFSTDTSKRKEQMEELNAFRQETESQILAKQRLQRKRKAMLEARLTKVCERRNIDKDVVHSYASTEVKEEEIPDAQDDVSSIPLPETVEGKEKKEPKIRPWDIGKSEMNFHKEEKKKMRTEKDWIEEQRNERQSKFAPPSFYTK